MKLTKVLLRWYKSFNVNYNGYTSDRRGGVVDRPWDTWKLNDQDEADFPFIEIPIEGDITTVVGANESGKSHLLGAISKVINGTGVPGDPFSINSKPSSFTQTDLCHFSPMLSKNLETWPHIGLEFSELTPTETNSIAVALGSTTERPASASITLLLMPEAGGKVARLFMGDERFDLDQGRLQAVRRLLPQVKFINSQVPIADQVYLEDLLAAYGSSNFQGNLHIDALAAQEAATLLASLSVSPAIQGQTSAITQDQVNTINKVKSLMLPQPKQSASFQLELMLFRDVLGIRLETLEKLYQLGESDRGYAESLIATWNKEIENRLNLSRYWQQDQAFTLRVNYKEKTLFFEITDKTEAVYTFRERSSGLRYFLSYYIQARSMEAALAKQRTIVLMDEPDSFLSILGQRNLLSIFETLVSPELSNQNTQIVYTTHSPFLINRNFPRRIRLVRKGDAEEGTQFIDQARVRRFEPVRSALGIDLAQTLFMGSTNLLLEGPTDQFLFTEAVRMFAGEEGMGDLLDLNAVTVVSAESAPGVERIVSASQWGDEPIPTAIVVLDGDRAGKDTRDQLIGKKRGTKKLLHDDFVVLISELLPPFGDNKNVVTTEDIVPITLYKRAIERYVSRWYPQLEPDRVAEVSKKLNSQDFANDGLVIGTKALFHSMIYGKSPEDHVGEYDKMGLLQEVIGLAGTDKELVAERQQLASNILGICRNLKELIERSQQAEQQRSGKQAIQRLIDDFFKLHKNATSTFDLEALYQRLNREVEAFGQDGVGLKSHLAVQLTDIKVIRSAGRNRLQGDEWQNWSAKIRAIRRNPLAPTTTEVSGVSDVLPNTTEAAQAIANSVAPVEKVIDQPQGADTPQPTELNAVASPT